MAAQWLDGQIDHLMGIWTCRLGEVKDDPPSWLVMRS